MRDRIVAMASAMTKIASFPAQRDLFVAIFRVTRAWSHASTVGGVEAVASLKAALPVSAHE